jgi:hypothetical protein
MRVSPAIHSGPMAVEPGTGRTPPARCEECGAKLTTAELQAAMEAGGPLLCSVHTAEDEPGLAVEDEGFAAP